MNFLVLINVVGRTRYLNRNILIRIPNGTLIGKIPIVWGDDFRMIDVMALCLFVCT